MGGWSKNKLETSLYQNAIFLCPVHDKRPHGKMQYEKISDQFRIRPTTWGFGSLKN